MTFTKRCNNLLQKIGDSVDRTASEDRNVIVRDVPGCSIMDVRELRRQLESLEKQEYIWLMKAFGPKDRTPEEIDPRKWICMLEPNGLKHIEQIEKSSWCRGWEMQPATMFSVVVAVVAIFFATAIVPCINYWLSTPVDSSVIETVVE